MGQKVIPFLNIKNPINFNQALISYSQLSIYSKCPKNWELQYIHKIKDKSPNIHFIFGTALHNTIQEWLVIMFGGSVKEALEVDLSSLFQKKYLEELEKVKARWGSLGEITPQMVEEFYQDGKAILEYLVKHRKEFFSIKDYQLLGTEIPIYTQPLPEYKVWFYGGIDVAYRDKNTGIVLIEDIKTSTRGWSEDQKKDKITQMQLLLYKKFFSEFLGVEDQQIDVRYLIAKRKLNPDALYPQKRIITFKPPNGKPSVNKAIERLYLFIKDNFNFDGSYRVHEREAIEGPGGYNCAWCMFREDYQRCPKERRKT